MLTLIIHVKTGYVIIYDDDSMDFLDSLIVIFFFYVKKLYIFLKISIIYAYNLQLFFRLPNMKKRFLLFIIFIMFVLSLVTFVLILNYLDPYEYKITALISIIFTFILWISTFVTLFLYFFKKIYFRGRVYIYHVLSSFRQSFFISIFALVLIFFNILWASLLLTWWLLLLILTFLELFIQNLEK